MSKHHSSHQHPHGERAKAESGTTPEPRPEEAAQPQTEVHEKARFPDVEEPSAKLREELEAAKDRELRCRAELDNVRKRAARELDEQRRYADMPLMRDLLPVLDNIDRAIQAAEQSADAAALLDGFRMVRQQMEDVLKNHHCIPIEALNAPFDPNVHHAVMQQPSEEHPANTVLMVTQNGYQLHDRVVRPSQVIVSKTP